MEWVFERKDGLSCVEFLYKAISHYYSIDYELAFVESWSFDFDSDTSLPSSNEGSRELNIEKFHGLKITNTVVKGRSKAYDAIKEIMSRRKICMVRVDLYYIPWSATCYMKRHWGHAILITDIREQGYFCYDYYSTSGKILPFDHIPEGDIKIITFDLIEPSSQVDTFQACTTLLKKVLLEKIKYEGAFNKMENFSNIFDSSFDIHDLTKDNVVFENSRFINSINRIAQCRFQFAIVLNYLNSKFPGHGFAKYADELSRCAIAWKSITSLIIKSYLLEDNSLIIRKVHDKVKLVKEMEERAYDGLMECIDGKFITDKKKDESQTLVNYNCYCLDLEAQFNHKAFSDTSNTRDVGLEGNEFLIVNESILTNDLVSNGFHFRLGDIRSLKYDNIECMGQIIEINRKGKAIMIMANAEYNHQIDFIEINNSHKVVKIEITVTSWHSLPVLDEKIIWEGKAGIHGEDGIAIDPIAKRIFAKVYQFPSELFISNITLPVNPNIHIFALTLCS